jgi:hypothetical protein
VLLTSSQIKKFQQLCEAHFGAQIEYSEAMEKATQLVRLMRIVYTPMEKTDLQRVLQRRKQIGLKGIKNE